MNKIKAQFKIPAILFLLALVVFLVPARPFAQYGAQKTAKAKVLYERAIEHEKNGRFREAIESARSIIKDYPSRTYIPNTLLLLGLCYENIYDFSKALRYYQKLLHNYQNYKIAKIARYKLDVIKKTYKLEKKPLIIFIHQERYIRKGEYEKALASCRRILADYPRSSLSDNAQNTIGYIYMNYLKQYNKAMVEYKKIISDYPDSNYRDNALFAIGRCFEHLELYQSAQAFYRLLKKRHEGGVLRKTNYWSRVWYTRSSYQIEKVEEKIQQLTAAEFLLDYFVESPFDVCLNDKRGAEDNKPRNIKTWVTPTEIKKLLKQEVKIKKYALFFTDYKQAILDIWNYVLTRYEIIPDVGDNDHWQFPSETAALRSGDDEDLCFLLGSLIIASGIESDNARVVFGKDGEGDTYRGVAVKYENNWYILNVNLIGKQDRLYLAKHERFSPEYAFNNKSFKVSPTSPVSLSRCQ